MISRSVAVKGSSKIPKESFLFLPTPSGSKLHSAPYAYALGGEDGRRCGGGETTGDRGGVDGDGELGGGEESQSRGDGDGGGVRENSSVEKATDYVRNRTRCQAFGNAAEPPVLSSYSRPRSTRGRTCPGGIFARAFYIEP